MGSKMLLDIFVFALPLLGRGYSAPFRKELRLSLLECCQSASVSQVQVYDIGLDTKDVGLPLVQWIPLTQTALGLS
jgi:hypothetical protein